MIKEEQSMHHKLIAAISNIVDQGYFKEDDEWKNVKELTEKPELGF